MCVVLECICVLCLSLCVCVLWSVCVCVCVLVCLPVCPSVCFGLSMSVCVYVLCCAKVCVYFCVVCVCAWVCEWYSRPDDWINWVFFSFVSQNTHKSVLQGIWPSLPRPFRRWPTLPSELGGFQSLVLFSQSQHSLTICWGHRQVIRGQELCESQGGRPGLPVPYSPYGLWTWSNVWRRRSRLRVDELSIYVSVLK